MFSTMDKRTRQRRQKKLLQLLREMRVEAGLRQVDLAERLNVDQPFISKYERGERRLDVLEVMEICQVLGIPFAEFIQRLEKALAE